MTFTDLKRSKVASNITRNNEYSLRAISNEQTGTCTCGCATLNYFKRRLAFRLSSRAPSSCRASSSHTGTFKRRRKQKSPLIDSSQLSAALRAALIGPLGSLSPLRLAVLQVTEHAPTLPPIQMAHASGEPAPNVTCHMLDSVSGDRRHFEVNTRRHTHTHGETTAPIGRLWWWWGVGGGPDQQGSLVMKLIMSCDSFASPPCEGFISVAALAT